MVYWHKHIYVTLPIRAWIVICAKVLGHMPHIVKVVWQMMSVLLQSQRHNAMRMGCWGRHVGSDVSKCTILLRLHDRWRQQCCGAKDAMPCDGLLRPTYWVGCVYMHHYYWVAWQMRSTLLRSRRCNAMIMGCWGWRVGSDMSICTILEI